MADNYSATVTLSVLTGSTSEVSKTLTLTDSFTEHVLFDIQIAAGASDTAITLGGLTDVKFLMVWADDTGITVKLGSGGTDAIDVDSALLIKADTDGLDISQLLFSNSGSTQVVHIFACE